MSPEITTHLHDIMSSNMAVVYACLFIAPFLQEDAAVIGAASLSLAEMGGHLQIFSVALIGLVASDLWKYWLGGAARRRPWAKRFASKRAVKNAEKLVLERLGATLTTVRFIPGARIPFYIAAGYFKAPAAKFAVWIVISAAAYLGLVFALFHALGSVAGGSAKFWAPVVAIGALLGYLIIQRLRAAGEDGKDNHV